jgi:hypothetical protein
VKTYSAPLHPTLCFEPFFKMSRNVFDSSVVPVCFSAALDNEIHADCHNRVPLNADNSKVPKKVQRSRYKALRPYNWKQPLKNKAFLRSKGLQSAKRTKKKANFNAEADLSKHREIIPSLKRERGVLNDEDNFHVDDLFEETD